MPEITKFYGIVIKMYFGDHFPPHFHAIYREYVGVFDINTLKMIEGDLLRRARELVVEWASKYQRELLEMLETHVFRKLPGLE